MRLLGLAGRRVFVDKNSIGPGTLWEATLREAIPGSQQMVLLWCCHSRQSSWVAAEVEQAVGEGKSIVPLLLCAEPVPEAVAKYQWIDLRSVVAHPCEHRDNNVGVATVEPRYFMPRKPGVMGLTYWDTLYKPEEYLDVSLSDNPAARAAAQAMTRVDRIFCAAVMRALELRWAENLRQGPRY